ncbi:MAG: carbohydrate ABC transporter permease [Halobacteriales archaeon]|nr:carbohydrate ABC transporter permease [Halobacteriales archaeon]
MSEEPESAGRFDPIDYRGSVPLWNRIDFPTRARIRRIVLHRIPLLIALLIILFPVYWVFNSAFLPQDELYRVNPKLFPTEPTLDNFYNLVDNTHIIQYYLNSLIMSFGVVVLTTVISTLGGYGLTRIDIPLKKTFARGILFGHMFPAILLAIPMFIFWRSIGLINSYVGAIFAITAISLPFSLWLMWQFFQSVPYSLEESAQMAGAPRFRAFYEIALPLAKPGMIAVATYSYAVVWNQFTIPIIILPNEQYWPLTIGIFLFTKTDQILWPQIMAAIVMTIIPSLLFVYALQKYLLRGFRVSV